MDGVRSSRCAVGDFHDLFADPCCLYNDCKSAVGRGLAQGRVMHCAPNVRHAAAEPGFATGSEQGRLRASAIAPRFARVQGRADLSRLAASAVHCTFIFRTLWGRSLGPMFVTNVCLPPLISMTAAGLVGLRFLS